MKGGLPIPIEWAATLLFAAAGMVGVVVARDAGPTTAATGIFYAVLVLNTWFSIRFFTSLPPRNRDERVVDGVLVAIYVALGLAIGRAMPFTLLSVALFAVAMLKYQMMKKMGVDRAILARKIVIDACGLLLCALAFLGVSLGYPVAATWTQAVVFTLANVYLLAIRPMYAA